MRIAFFVFFFSCFSFLITTSFSSCQKEPVNAEPKEIKLSQDQQMLLAESNGFAFDLFRDISAKAGDNENVFVSPLSVSLALAMAYNGASGTTLEAMHQAMQLPDLSVEKINEAYRQLIGDLASVDPKVIMNIANSIWYREGFSVEPAFLQVNKTFYDAEIRGLDFSDPSATDIINNWVATKTKQLIRKIIDGISDETVMYVINAIYFKGEWKHSFDLSESGPGPFNLAGGGTKSVRMMRQNAELNHYADENFSVVELPYGRGNYSMLVVLPAQGTGIGHVMQNLSSETWQLITSDQLAPRKVDLKFPALKFAFEQRLKDVLTGMGMGVAFTPGQAGFAGINPTADLFINDVIHKAFVEVNEEGTEAAAVTAVEFAVTSVGPDTPVAFYVDRPFLFFIKEKYTNTVIFAGKIMEPVIE